MRINMGNVTAGSINAWNACEKIIMNGGLRGIKRKLLPTSKDINAGILNIDAFMSFGRCV